MKRIELTKEEYDHLREHDFVERVRASEPQPDTATRGFQLIPLAGGGQWFAVELIRLDEKELWVVGEPTPHPIGPVGTECGITYDAGGPLPDTPPPPDTKFAFVTTLKVMLDPDYDSVILTNTKVEKRDGKWVWVDRLEMKR